MEKKDIKRALVSSLTSTLRLWRGTFARRSGAGTKKPEKMLVLYDMESCPFCRLVREVLTELDLDALIIPVAKGDAVARDALKSLGGKVQVPYLVDENTGQSLYESRDIINYLRSQYGNGRQSSAVGHQISVASSLVASATRPKLGIQYSGVSKPEQALELYSFESSPFSRPVRERLTELGLPYIVRNFGKQQMSDVGSPEYRFTTKPYVPLPGSRREAFNLAHGKVQVPYLIDPNTQQAMFESWDMMDYLDKTYG